LRVESVRKKAGIPEATCSTGPFSIIRNGSTSG
jgi:hypothetical protein